MQQRTVLPPALFFVMGLCLAVHSASAGERDDRTEALTMAAEIDRIVGQARQQQGVQPNEMTSDEQFLRRAYLDIIGRIPTYAEAMTFAESDHSDKRYDLIDQLMETEGYVSHTYNYWADVLRVKTRLVPQVGGLPYIQWIRQSIRDNKSYDQFVYEMLTASGRITDDGAAGYFIRDSGMPLDNLANTVRIFLGTQIGCAQCHDHPYDVWSQREFYELAAFLYPMSTRDRGREVRMLRRDIQQMDLKGREQQLANQLLQSETFRISDMRRPLRLPDDYKYSDGKPGEVVTPHTLFGEQIELTGSTTPRLAFAAWVTDWNNPRFAPVIANRLWARAMGVGLVDPVDDFQNDTVASIPPLLDYLTGQMKALSFDMKMFSKAIYYSQTYQRQAQSVLPQPGEPYYFPGPALRRMTAEQLWDSVLTLIVPDLDGRESALTDRRAQLTMVGEDLDVTMISAEQLVSEVRQFAEQAGRGRARMRQLQRDEPEKYRGLPAEFVRASDWLAPARPGSFLQQFGASDRELIDSADRDPTATQALEMMNGRTSNQVLNSQSALAATVAGFDAPGEKIRAIFISILGREPGRDDMQIALDELKQDPKNGLPNIAAALLNTREFMFVQ